MGDCFSFCEEVLNNSVMEKGHCIKHGEICPWKDSESDRIVMCADFQDEDHVDEVL